MQIAVFMLAISGGLAAAGRLAFAVKPELDPHSGLVAA